MPFAACADAAVNRSSPATPQTLLVLVAHHPPADHIRRLKGCLKDLDASIRYALVINDHISGEPAETLLPDAAMAIVQSSNPGYGRAFNQLWRRWCNNHDIPALVAVLNTDLSWHPGCFETLMAWLQQHPAVTAATPLLEFTNGERQFLCKGNPTLLALLSRRFIPIWIKPKRLLSYDRWYTMRDSSTTNSFLPAISAAAAYGCGVGLLNR